MKSSCDLDIEDIPLGSHLKIAVIASLFNGDITKEMVRCCMETLEEYGCRKDQVDIYWVPGAWELPQTAKILARKRVKPAENGIDLVIAIGCVIKGETSHYDYVAGEASNGLGEAARSAEFPVIFGVLTTDTWDQAWERASEAGENKGRELAKSGLHMIRLFQKIEK